MRARVVLLIGLMCVVAGVASPALADGSGSGAEKDFEIVLEPYLWAAGIAGEVGSAQSPSATGTRFADLLEILELGAMGVVSARYKRVGIFGDGNYMRVGDNVAIRESLLTGLTDVDMTINVGFGTGAVFYRLRPKRGLTLDPYAGVRWWVIDAEFDFNPGGPTVSPSRSWVDAVVGLKMHYRITDHWFIEALADAGGISSDFTWQAYGAAGYHFVDWFALTLGFRYMGTDYQEDGFLFDATLQGALIGLKFRI